MNLISISFLVILLFDVIKGQYVLEKFQYHLYNENHGYFHWILSHKRIVFSSLDFFSFVCFVLSFLLTGNISVFLTFIAFFFYILELFRILSLRKLDYSSHKLILSKRMKRLIFTLSFFYLVPLVFYLADYPSGYLCLSWVSLFSYLLFFLPFIAKIINIPLDKMISDYQYRIALEKRNQMKDLNVIGVTGTYGKSSTKNIVNTVLGEAFICQMTPKNLNTLHGLVMTINTYLDFHENAFIVEMGSYRKGEVQSICHLARPKYAIITNIENVNLNNFDTTQESIAAKFELVESLDKNGVAILNKDDYLENSYVITSPCKKVWISTTHDADYMASDISYSKEGTTFQVFEKSTSQKYPIETKLLGEHNLYHVLSSIALAREMGMEVSQIQKAILKVRPLENHLELRNFGYMHQISNTHKSNPRGAKNALDVLDLMPGLKVVVTTGMQTFGEKGKEFNNIFGTQVAKVADYVILIGEKSTKSVFQGLMESGFDSKKVYIVNRVIDAYTLLQEIKTKKEIYALFESDEDLKY